MTEGSRAQPRGPRREPWGAEEIVIEPRRGDRNQAAITHMTSTRLNYIEDQMRHFTDLPREVFFKEDLLRLGLSLNLDSGSPGAYQKKSYFIFSFDRTPIGQMERKENLRAPEEIALVG